MTGRITEFTEATPTDDDYLEFIDLAEAINTDARNKRTTFGDLRGVNSCKDSVRVATTTNGDLATAYENGDTVDGVVLNTGDRILLKNQTTGSEDGIYTVNASGAPTRAKDFDTSTDARSGSLVLVQEGTTNADTIWQLTTNAPITLGSTSLTFTQVDASHNLLSSKHGDTLSGTVVRGDSIVGNSTPAWSRIGIGTASKRWKSDGTDPSWAWDNVVTKTSTATLVDSEEIILVNPSTSAMTINLPPASGRGGKKYKLIYISTTGQPVTIDADGSETINGKLTVLHEHKYTQWYLRCDGSNWFGEYSSRPFASFSFIDLIDDFNGVDGSVIGNLSWAGQGVGTEVIESIAGEANHFGIYRFSTGGASGDDCIVFLGETPTIGSLIASDDWSVTFLIRITGTLANATRRYGLFGTATSNSNETSENACFLFDTAVSANWRMRTRSSGGTDQTTTGSGAVTLNTWYKLKIVNDGGTIRFYINDINVANHSTQVPSGAVLPVITVDNTSASSRSHDIDYFNIRVIQSR